MITWAEYLGRWHVAVIHLPIGLLVAGALVEVYGAIRRFQSPTVSSVIMALMGAAGTILAAALGWILANHTKHPGSEHLVEWHRWAGIIAAGLAVITASLGVMALRGRLALRWPYRLALLITAVAIGLTAHWGGELIYGEDYFALPGSAASAESDDL